VAVKSSFSNDVEDGLSVVVVVVVLCWKHKEVAEAAAVEVEYPVAEMTVVEG
jgi:hypothetical protein